MIEFKLPSLGADMDKGKLLEWKVRPGDQVRRGDVVAVVDTSKVAVDVEIWTDGIVHELIARPGVTIPVGAVMATLLEPDVSTVTSPSDTSHEMRGQPAAAAGAPRVETAVPIAAVSAGRRRVSPVARRRAAELGIDPETVSATGPHDSVTLEDVERAATAAKSAPEAAAKDTQRQAEMRRAIAAAMSRSKREIPHYYLSERIPLQNATAWLQAENANRPVTERVLMAALLLKATALACDKYPDMNGLCIDGRYAPAASVHVGVAVSLRHGGLIAPAIHDVQRKGLIQLMQDLTDLVKRARSGSLRSSEMSDPTITVTNLGDQGVESVFGVIYPPQVALVGFGRVDDHACVVAGGLRIVPAVMASLAADHRVSDGHRGALFLSEIRHLLQQPETL